MLYEEFQNYLDVKLNKRYEQAKFYLDILIESGTINMTDEKIKDLFLLWFSENKKIDLQIKNGDFEVEEGDFKIVPDFNKSDIIEFVNWFNKEKGDFLSYLEKNGVSSNSQERIAKQIIKAENIVINNGKIEKIHQKSIPDKKENKIEKVGIIIAIVTGAIALFTFIFGDNIYEKFIQTSNKTNKELTNKEIFVESTLAKMDVPYLFSEPILDKGLFIEQNYSDFVLGGANIDNVSVNARRDNGERIEIKKDENGNLKFNIFSKPYIEFSYKDKFYSIEIISDDFGKSFKYVLKQIGETSLNLTHYKKIV